MTKIDHEVWWNLYPRKVSKGDSMRAWAQIKPEDQQKIINCLPNFRWPKERRYIPYPATWLRGMRWLDEPEPDDLDYERIKAVERIKSDRAFWHAQEGASKKETYESLIARGLTPDEIQRFFR